MDENRPAMSVTRLKTPILNSEGKPINYQLSECPSLLSGLAGDKAVKITFAGKILGVMRFSFYENYIFIDRMNNETRQEGKSFKGIGTLFFEYAFRQSINSGKGGNIELNAAGESPMAFYKMGLRKKSTPAEWMKDQIVEYLAATTQEEKELKKKQLENNSFYDSLKKEAAINSKKNTSALTVDEIIRYGLMDSFNQDFENLLNTDMETARVKSKYMNGTMYLPADQIELLKRKFINPSSGSNLFFDQDFALKTFLGDNPEVMEDDAEADKIVYDNFDPKNSGKF